MPPLSQDAFKDRVRNRNPNFEVLSEYKGMRKKILRRCTQCGDERYVLAHHLMEGHGCPKCKLSRGAKSISQYLKEHDIVYEAEYRFDDCADERPLPFDFYLPELNTVIEYDGEQHFGPVRFGQYTEDIAIAKFEQAQKHDAIKNKYCETHNINLIRIPYTDFDEIPNILDKLIS